MSEIGKAVFQAELPAFELRWRNAKDQPCSIKIYKSGKVVSEPHGNPSSLVVVNRLDIYITQAYELGRIEGKSK